MAHKLLLLPGDGIGVEVMGEVTKLVAWLNAQQKGEFTTDTGLVGGSAFDKHGEAISEEDMGKALASDAVIFGAVGGPKWDNVAYDKRPEAGLRRLRKDLKLIADLMNESGISGMRFSISETAKWGDITVGPKVIDASVKKRMKAALKDIQSGKFAKNWVKEYKGGFKKYNALLKKGENHPIEKTGAKLRALMPWVGKKNIKGAQAAY